MELTSKTLAIIKESQRIKSLLALENGCSESTIYRWIIENNPMLTTASSLKIIREETGLTDRQILTEAEKKAS